jgi:hypothetical protein
MQKKISLSELKNKIVETRSPFINIYTDVTNNLEHAVLKTLPSFSSLRDAATKTRNLQDGFNIEEHDIQKSLRITLNAKKFLQYDSGVVNKSRFLIFFNENFWSIY